MSSSHNRGQSDGARRRYNPPPSPGLLDHFMDQVFGGNNVERERRARNDYNKGYRNGRKDR